MQTLRGIPGCLTVPSARKIDRMDDGNVYFDLNHPLSGKFLTFAVEVLGISETAVQQNEGCGCSSSAASCGCGDSGCC